MVFNQMDLTIEFKELVGRKSTKEKLNMFYYLADTVWDMSFDEMDYDEEVLDKLRDDLADVINDINCL